MSQTAAVILAAGLGKRMRSDLPKVLHRVAGRPMLQYVIDAAHDAGIGRIVVVLGHAGEQVRAVLDSHVETVIQTEQRGTADAVLTARPLLHADPSCQDVLIANGDCPLLTSTLFQTLIAERRRHGAAIAMAVSSLPDPTGYGRILRDESGRVAGVIEEAAASEVERAIREVNAGVYCIEARWLWERLPSVPRSASGEYYLTDVVGLAVADERLVRVVEASPETTSGVNDRVQLAVAERHLRDRIRHALMISGVTILDPPTTYVDSTARIDRDTILYPGTIIEGTTVISTGCVIGPYSRIVDSQLSANVVVNASVVEQSTVAAGVRIGPFSHLRPGARIESGAVIGNYAEIKNSHIGPATQMHHFSYVGDAEVGRGVNVGAGTITCNFDSESGDKNRTIVGAGASLGCDTMLVAPVTVGERAMTGAGSVVNRDVESETVVVGVPARPFRRRRAPPS
ncbi:MAG TPA: bifunctional UDP-N-acetylglucosamine diphosphorylase/glucosamine-1-phosphate N-acetyltransferase GlmU [Chloroflexota bacterium]|nr:bifunctional UDP-N-acetylglucosamine diphosphorylase/glucosamine-1-phosphate N-acetyltransferase GlmU [Chloroflexota bacterium]